MIMPLQKYKSATSKIGITTVLLWQLVEFIGIFKDVKIF
jgi:hypothetical protein